MKKRLRKTMSALAAGAVMFSMASPVMNTYAKEVGAVKQFMDCFLPMPIVEELKTDCWGADSVGPRDQGNGLEDRDMSTYSYWDGGILKDDVSGKYYMFASRWDQESGHSGWKHSNAIYATSDNFYGPYEDHGPIDGDAGEAGHNVFPFELSETDPLRVEGYKYAIVTSDSYKNSWQVNGAIHVAKSLNGPWENLGIMQGAQTNTNGLNKSNICIIVRPDGTYETINRNGDIWTADQIKGPWKIESEKLWWKVEGMPTNNMEDPIMWYSDGLYHVVVNEWNAREAYYMTSENGLTGWVRHSGIAYTPKDTFMSYTNGTLNNWTKLERPNVYVEDGELKAMTFAVIDAQKEVDFGYDTHGSKIVIIPFDGQSLKEFAKTNVYVDPLVARDGIDPIEDSTIQSWEDEVYRNYGGERFIQLQGNNSQGVFGEGQKPSSDYDCKIGFLKYDISQFARKDIENASLSIVFKSNKAGSAKEDNIRVCLSDSNWKEGIGNEVENDGQADEGTLTWMNQPELKGKVDDLENTVSSSERFSVDAIETEVKVDVTKLVKQFKKENPDKNIISFALSEVEGNRIQIERFLKANRTL